MTDTPIAQALAAFDEAPPIIEADGKHWLLFDGFQIAPHSEGGVMVILGYKDKANTVLRFEGVELRSLTDDPEACVLTVSGLDGRQEVKATMNQREAANGAH
jgi:hypothetical protein